MQLRSSLALLAGLSVHLVGCGATVDAELDASTGSGGGSATSGAGAAGGTGASGASGSGATGSGGTGSGGGPVDCPSSASVVYACASSSEKPAPDQPWAFTNPGTIVAIRDPDAGEPCSDPGNYGKIIGSGAPAVMIDLLDAAGHAATVGVNVPGFSSSSLTVGELVEVAFSLEWVDWGGTYAQLRIDVGGALVVGVGENVPLGLDIAQGQSECLSDDGRCGREQFEMTVVAEDGTTASIPTGGTAEIDELMVTSRRYIQNYDTSGGCNFGLSVEYLVGVAAKH